MSRFARQRRVYFFEEPQFEAATKGWLQVSICSQTDVHICTPVLPIGLSPAEIVQEQQSLLRTLLQEQFVTSFIAWYYTPMAREFSHEFAPDLVIYDCMDELSEFAGAPPAMKYNEAELLRVASLVFTGGASLYEAKRRQHTSVHAFPSSVDAVHFRTARNEQNAPEDQVEIPHPRIGYAGVIDERMDVSLLQAISEAKPDWHFILLGPVVKIESDSLPRAKNLHYLGMKSYSLLPTYLSGWDLAMLPFALNNSTRFISPTKTPEYLAAGLPVISTPIRDVVSPYGELGFVAIAANAAEFIKEAELLLENRDNKENNRRVDAWLAQTSWDDTWHKMNMLIEKTMASRGRPPLKDAQLSTKYTNGLAHV